MTEDEDKMIAGMNIYIGALSILVGGLLAVLDEKMPDLRKDLRGAIQRQHGGGLPPTQEQLDLAFGIIDGLRHFTRN